MNILNNLLENTRSNVVETREIVEKYDAIRDKLININDEITERMIKNRELLIQKENQKKGFEEIQLNPMITGIIFVPAFLCGIQIIDDKINLLEFCLVTIIVAAGIHYLIIIRYKDKIQRVDREIRRLANLEGEYADRETSIGQLHRDIKPIAVQMNVFNNYWATNHSILEDLVDRETDTYDEQAIQSKILILKTIERRWESIRQNCDNYTRTVRRLIDDAN